MVIEITKITLNKPCKTNNRFTILKPTHNINPSETYKNLSINRLKRHTLISHLLYQTRYRLRLPRLAPKGLHCVAQVGVPRPRENGECLLLCDLDKKVYLVLFFMSFRSVVGFINRIGNSLCVCQTAVVNRSSNF